MTNQPPIAGVGFTAGGLRPDLSGTDETLARIEDAGVSHCELPLFAAQLVSGGRVLPDMARQLEAACARRSLRYTVHGVLSVNLMDAYVADTIGGLSGGLLGAMYKADLTFANRRQAMFPRLCECG